MTTPKRWIDEQSDADDFERALLRSELDVAPPADMETDVLKRVMAVVAPEERAAAASVTAVPRSLASAVSPMIAGWLLTLSPFGWPLVICGSLKIVYDLLLLAMFRRVRPPEESN